MIKVTVITATWNSAATISETLDSLSLQDYNNIEYIVIDGASIDNTVEIVKKYGDMVSKIVSENDNGIYDALNKGIGLADGDVIGFLHSDDFFSNSNVISKIAEAFNDQNVDAVYGDLDYVAKDDITKIIRRWKSGPFEYGNLRNGWMPPHPTFYLRKKHYERLGKFNLSYSISADYDSILRFLWKNRLVPKYIPSVLVKMRVGGESNRSLTNIIKKTKEDKSVMKSNDLPYFRALLLKNLSKIPQFLRFYRN